MQERVRRIGQWFKDQDTLIKEYKRFKQFFPKDIPPSGVLTKPGEEIYPLAVRLVTTPNSRELIGKLSERKKLSAQEVKSLIVPPFKSSFSGTYDWNLNEQGEQQLKIALGNHWVSEYLSANSGTMMAFVIFEKRINPRHGFNEAVSVRVGDQDHSIIFNFPQIKETPKSAAALYLYTKPSKAEDYVIRLNLLLHVSNK